MKNYTKKWEDYLKNEWEDYLEEAIISVFYPEVIYNGNYNEELLKGEFDKYYKAKKKYVSMIDYFEKEFGIYEEIELLDKDREFQQYINRVNLQADILKENLINSINEKWNKPEDYNPNKINIDKIDFKLLALGKVNLETRDTYREAWPYHKKIYELCNGDITRVLKENILYKTVGYRFVNKFLTNYEEYYENLNDKLAVKKLNNYYFHDHSVLSFIKKDNDIIMAVCVDEEIEGVEPRFMVELTFKNAKVSGDIEDYFSGTDSRIEVYDKYSKYYSDVGYYVYFEFLKFQDECCPVEKEFIITSDDLIVSPNRPDIINFV